ncbi:hypothetical protein Patl1_35150 [Pistacia atlantica]|uniref:Uncharacterized protein n=1 Tax=Pistacia atlantica TaxID=434234 RepID=A0ACC0ZVD0_9ROSI|nr:hypothetical protein Patl1_35150 [Pistacia atlantica]
MQFGEFASFMVLGLRLRA